MEAGGLLSVALALGSPPVPIKNHPTLWSPDFPPVSCETGDRLCFFDHYLILNLQRQRCRYLDTATADPAALHTGDDYSVGKYLYPVFST